MGASSAHHAVCAPVSERYVCCFTFFPFFLRRLVSGCCTHTSVWRRQLSFTFNFVSCFSCHRVFSFFNFSQFCSFNRLISDSPPLHTVAGLTSQSNGFGHSLSLPAENWTCFIKANPHVHCAHSVIHLQLHHRPSRVFRMCGFFSSSTMFPARVFFTLH